MFKSIYMDNRWGELQQQKEKGEAIFYEFTHKEGKVYYPFIKRQAGEIDNVMYYDIVTPRGQCGPWIKTDNPTKTQELIKDFNDEFQFFCDNERIIAELIRFDPWNRQEKYFSDIYNINLYGEIYANDLSIDFFKEEYNSNKRNEVRKAIKNNITVKFSKESSSIENFLNLYEFTQNKYNVSEYYLLDKEFITSYIEKLNQDVIFVEAQYEDKVISSSMLLFGKDIAHYHFSASNPEYLKLNANGLLLYESAIFAQKQGKKYFDLGGAKYGSNLAKFKARISKPYQSFKGTTIRNKNIYNMLIEKRGSAKENYFPAYRKG